jgi:hypothetical protein
MMPDGIEPRHLAPPRWTRSASRHSLGSIDLDVFARTFPAGRPRGEDHDPQTGLFDDSAADICIRLRITLRWPHSVCDSIVIHD